MLKIRNIVTCKASTSRILSTQSVSLSPVYILIFLVGFVLRLSGLYFFNSNFSIYFTRLAGGATLSTCNNWFFYHLSLPFAYCATDDGIKLKEKAELVHVEIKNTSFLTVLKYPNMTSIIYIETRRML